MHTVIYRFAKHYDVHVTASSRRTWTVFASAAILSVLLLSLWVQLTPLGSAPDEASHFIKAAAVVRGQPTGDELPGWVLSIDGWAHDVDTDVKEIVVVRDGEVVKRAEPNVLRDDVNASLSLPPGTIAGFSIWVTEYSRGTEYSIFAALEDGRTVPLQLKSDANVLTSPTDARVDGQLVDASDSILSLVEDSHFNGRMEYSHWSTYVDLDPQFDGANAVQRCFVSQPAVPACGLRVQDQSTTDERPITAMGLYTPVVYLIPGLGTLSGANNDSWFAARLWSALAAALIIALCVVNLVRRNDSLLPLLSALAPAVIFLASVVNPSGLELVGAIALWITTPGLLLADRRDRWEISTFALSGVVLILARPLGMVYFASVIFVCVVASGTWRTAVRLVGQHRIVAILHATTLLFATWWYLFVYNPAVDPRRAEYLAPDVALPEQILHAFGDVYRVLLEAMGDLGSLEVPIPRLMFVLLVAVAIWLISLGTTSSTTATKVALTSLVVMSVLLVLATDINYYRILRGYGVQGRHIMPLLVGLPLLAARHLRLSSVARTTVIGAWVLTQFIAGFTALRRYSVGIVGDNFFAMFSEPAWQPPLDISTTLVLLGIVLLLVAYGTNHLESRRS